MSPTARGIRSTISPRYADGPTARYVAHMFDMHCREIGIEHRLTKVTHSWSEEDQATVQWTRGPTNDQVERMSRTIKEATVERFHYDDHKQPETHLAEFVSTYNVGFRLKTMRGLTPYEFVCKNVETSQNASGSIPCIECRD